MCYIINMWTFKKCDLIAKSTPKLKNPLKIGIVIYDNEERFSVKWTSFNKKFFMEKEGDIFQELNNTYLLGIDSFQRNDQRNFFTLLNSNYCDGKAQKKISKYRT